MDNYRDDDETMSSTDAVLSNQDLMEIVLNKLRGGMGQRLKRQFSNLRLVSRTFNTAVLNLPHPSPFHLHLSRMFPQLIPKFALMHSAHITPVPQEEIPTIPQQLAKTVGMDMSMHLFGNGDSEAGTLAHFCSIYGSSIRVLKLTGLKEGQLSLVALAIDNNCHNLKELSLDMNTCSCVDVDGREGGAFTFSNTKPKLASLKLRDRTIEDDPLWESWQGLCPDLCGMVSALVGVSPNLESLQSNSNMFLDLSRHGMMTCLDLVVWPAKPSASSQALMNMLTGPCRTLQSLKIRFDGPTYTDHAGLVLAMERDLRLPSMQNLKELHLIFRLKFTFGPALASVIFSPVTANLRCLTVVAPEGRALEAFLHLIRDNALQFVNRTVEKLVLRGSAAPISHLIFLPSAFPNIRSAELPARLEHPDDGEDGMGNLANTLRSTVCGWKFLEDLNLHLDFPITFEDLGGGLEDLGEDFWRNESVRRVRLEFVDVAALFPIPQDMDPDTGSMEDAFLAMRGLERVTLANLMMPAGVTQSLLRFIAENDLPVSFLEIQD